MTMKHLLIALPLLLLPVMAGCSAEQVANPTQAVQLEEMKQREATAESALAAARDRLAAAVTEDERVAARVDVLRLEGELEGVQAELAHFEAALLRERGGLLTSMLTGIFGPAAIPVSAAAVWGLAPLAGRRGRKLYVRALKQLNPFDGNPGGDSGGVHEGVSPVQAAMDVARALGLAHSSDSSKAASGLHPAPA